MKKIYYEKVGRRYVPVSEYDNDFLDSFTKGNHLVMSYPGGTSRRYNVDPNYAAMIAAGRVAELGEDARQLEWPSVRECAEAGVRAMQEEADKLMKHASVRAAYEQFQLVCMLAKEADDVETR